PDTNVISDKDRVASSRKPQVDPKELRKILDSARPGNPGPTAPPAPPQPQQAPAVAQNAAPPQQLQQGQPASSPSPSASQNQLVQPNSRSRASSFDEERQSFHRICHSEKRERGGHEAGDHLG